jgi:hypothetical protein
MIRKEHRQIGTVILVKKYLGHNRNWIGHVTHVRDLKANPTKDIQGMNRSRYLVTLEILGPLEEGEPKHRSIYDAYADITLIRRPKETP